VPQHAVQNGAPLAVPLLVGSLNKWRQGMLTFTSLRFHPPSTGSGAPDENPHPSKSTRGHAGAAGHSFFACHLRAGDGLSLSSGRPNRQKLETGVATMHITINTLRRNPLAAKTFRSLPLLALAATVCLFGAPLLADPMSKADREHLLVHFEMTTQMVAEQVRGLSPGQLEYKASPDRWSIREVVSHLAVAEPDYWREIQKALKAAPDMNTKKSQATDADIMWYGIDRVVHTKTGGGHEKVDIYKDLGEALGRFQALRATMIEYIKTTNDDLRAHSFGDYGEVIDCWQWMLEISTHSERHINQIREIKNDPNFPKR
jgi:DinB superfamily